MARCTTILKVLFGCVGAALMVGLAGKALAWDYGNGRHGSYVLTTNATIEQLYQTVRVTNDPAQYNPFDSNAIPNFQNLIITNGATLTAESWTGSTGGRIVFKVQSTMLIGAGSAVSVSGLGYRGGISGIQGESYMGSQSASESGNFGGGGGGLAQGSPNGNSYYYPAGGGGYGSGGQNGTINVLGTLIAGGMGGAPYGNPAIDIIYLGSGGGGGVAQYGPAPSGGNGGGAISLNVGDLQLEGQILANGLVGGPNTGPPGYGFGGGGSGSGGSVLLHIASGRIGTNNVVSLGGTAGLGPDGGQGRIAIFYAEGFTGTTSPSAYTAKDTNSDNITVITHQPADQTNFLGSNAVFRVGVYGVPTLAFQWDFNGIPIRGATNGTLILTNIALTDTGDYSVSISNAVMTLLSSNAFLMVLDTATPFNDGIPNWWKSQYGLSLTDPTLATNHPAGDLLNYLEKYLYGLNPLTNDTDGDGLSDYNEVFVYHTNPTNAYTAGDGIPDGWKVQYGLNPLIADANNEAGFDGVTYMQVYEYDLAHTNQLNPNTPFGLGPGLSSYEILNGGQHTNKFYYDHEDRLLGLESSRGISIGYQYDGNGNLVHQAVLSRASETNGLPVLWLWLNGLSNQPGIAYQNSSGSGWDNYQEWLAGLNASSNSVPGLTVNPGTNIGSLTVPFTPANFGMAAGNLDGVAGDEIVVGGDGNPGTNNNSLFVLTQTATNWSTQAISVGSFGITSIAIGQPTNRPSAGIYVGLRGTNGTGQITEFMNSGGIWQSNVIAVSADSAAFLVGVRSNKDVLASLSTTNGPGGALWSLTCSNGVWNQQLVSTNTSHTSGITAALQAQQTTRMTGIRILDSGELEVFDAGLQLIGSGALVPAGALYNPASDKWYFTSPSTDTWNAAQSYCNQLQGNLATISSDSENQWIQNQFPGSYFLGLAWGYMGGPYPQQLPALSGGWIDGSASLYRNWEPGQPYMWATGIAQLAVSLKDNTGHWLVADGGNPSPGIGEIFGWSWKLVLPTSAEVQPLRWPGSDLTAGALAASATNAMSVFRALVDDRLSTGRVEPGDDLVIFEYDLQTNTWSTNLFARVPITTENPAQAYGIASVNFVPNQPNCLFSAEPDGQIFTWSSASATNVVRQLFSPDYAGQAWQGLRAVGMPGIGEGLAGLLVSPTNQSTCSVVFWAPQAALPVPKPSLLETAPYAAVIPTNIVLGENAGLIVRLWHAEGAASTPSLQYQILGTTSWSNATLTTLDGLPYSTSLRVAALPTGSDHRVVWSALTDLGSNVATNVLLRARAQDFMLTGDWSLATPFEVNTFPPTSLSVGPPQILSNGGFGFSVNGGVLGKSYTVLASTNLIDWLPISDYVFTNPPVIIIDPNATNFPRRFYEIGP